MDIVSHGLWGGIAFGRSSRKEFIPAFLWGITPDALSFGIFAISVLLGFDHRPSFGQEPPNPSLVPHYVSQFYNITHSFIIAAIVIGAVWAFRKRLWTPMLAWPLHIMMDIPFHTTAFFPTPFLWPLSDIRVNGIAWGTAIVWLPNIGLLILAYTLFFWKKKRGKQHSSPKI